MARESIELVARREAARLVSTERARQSMLGYGAAHDDKHPPGDLAQAGMSYALVALSPTEETVAQVREETYPWEGESFDPDPGEVQKNLVKAVALLQAELERSIRVAARFQKKQYHD